MNHIYRLVFNRALGVLQVASELARSAGSAATVGNGRLTAALRPVSFALWVALGWVGMVMPGTAQQAPSASASGRIVADPGAPRTQRPTVVAAPNGTPLVNITTPSAAGVSRNTYSQFDVGSQGAILNNARTSTQTQLGGWVQGNPWLATGTARVILNEVNSANPSHLDGYIEVAGDRAEVIIANPAGIQVDGGGFLNASRATLTTGKPIFNGGSLDHYRVEGGVIGVNGAGLDASRTDYTNLIARSLHINAGLWAQQLSVTTGVNTVDATDGAVQRGMASTPAPALAIDVGQLGGMYAGKITLIGTEHGVGVRNAGAIGAQAGDLIVTVDGRLENAGQMQAQNNAALDLTGGVGNAGLISAGQELRLGTAQDVDNGGGQINARRLDINALGLSNRDGSIEQTGAQALQLQAGALSNRDGGRIGLATLTSDGSGTGAGTDSGTGGTSGEGTDGSTPTDSNTPTVTPPPVVPLAEGVLRIAGTLNNDAGAILASGGIGLDTDTGLNNDGGELGLASLTVTHGDVSNQAGTLAVQGSARIQAGTLDNDSGQFSVGGPLDLNVQTFSNRGGEFLHGGSDATQWQIAEVLDNTAGRLASNAGSLQIGAGVLVNEQGRIEHAGADGMALAAGTLQGAGGQISTAGALTIAGQRTDLRDGTTSAGTIDIDTGALVTAGGVLQSGSALNLDAAQSLDNAGGQIIGSGDTRIATASLDNTAGAIQHAGTGTLDIRAATLAGAGGTLASNGTLAIAGQSTDLSSGTTIAQTVDIDTGVLVTAGGTLQSGGALNLDATQRLDNAGGQIAGNGDIRIATTHLDNTDGFIQHAGTGTLDLQASTLDGAGGTIASNGAFTLTGQSTDLSGGTTFAQTVDIVTSTLSTAGGSLQSGGTLDVSARQSLDNTGGHIAGNGDTRLTTAVLNNTGGTIQHAGTGTLAIQASTLDGAGGTIAGNGALTLTGQSIDLSGGTTVAQTVDIDTGVLVTADGALQSGGALNLDATQSLDNAGGQIAGNGDTRIATASLNNTAGTIQHAGSGTLDLQASTLDGADGTIASNGALTLTGQSTDLSGGTTFAQTVAITTATLSTAGGTLQSGGTLTLNAGQSLDNAGGQIVGNGDTHIATALLDNTAGTIQHAGTGTLAIQADTLDGASGTIAGNGALILTGQSIDLRGGTTSAGTIDIDADTLVTAGGSLQSGGRLNLTATDSLDNAGGQIIGNGDTAIATVLLNNAAGAIQHAGSGTLDLQTTTLSGAGGTIGSNGALSIRGVTIDLRGGATFANALAIDASTLVTADGTLQSADTLNLDATQWLDNAGGQIVGGGDTRVATTVLNNQAGSIQQAGTGTLDLQTATLDGAGGTLASNGALMITGQETDLSGGTTFAQTVAITTTALNTASGTLQSASTLDLDASQSWNNRGGQIASNGVLTARTGMLDNQSGTIGSADTLILDAGTLTNGNGRIESGADASVQVAGAIDNRAGQIVAQSALTVAGSRLDNDGGVVAAIDGALDLAIGGAVSNLGGQLQSGTALTLRSDGFDNTGGGLYGTTVTIDAGTGALDNDQGRIAGQSVQIGSGALSNDAGLIQAATSLAIDTHGQALTNTRSGSEFGISSGGSLQLSTGDLINATGAIVSVGSAAVQADGVINAGGQISSQDTLTLRGSTLDNRGGQIQALGDVGIDVGTGTLDNQGGLIGSAASVTLDAASLINRDTQGADQGIWGANTTITADTIDNVGGLLSADQTLTITGSGALDNTGGQIVGGTVELRDPNATRTLDNTEGTIAADQLLNLQARGITGNGTLQSGGDATIVLVDSLDNQSSILANRDLSLSTQGDLSNAGAIQAGGELVIHANAVDNTASGEISAAVGGTHITADTTLTNRGLIDSAATRIDATRIDNLGTGRIYGDRVSLGADTINNGEETIDGVTRSGTIAARERLDIGAVTLNNRREALIYSGGDAAIGGALDADGFATGTAASVNNTSAVIDVDGALAIDAVAINNVRENVVITQTTTTLTPERLDQPYWRNNGGNTTTNIRTSSNYAASEVYYLHPDDILEDGPYITPDGYTVRRAVIRLTSQTSAYFFGRGGLYAALGERSRMNVEDGTVTLYYFGRQDNQVNPDQVTTGADDPFAELSAPYSPGDPQFRYIDDNLTYSSAYGTCTTNCVQLWGQYDYDDPDHILINPQGTGGGSLGDNEQYRIATQTVTEDVLVPGAGAEAVIRSGGAMFLTVDDLTNRYGQIAAGGDLAITDHSGGKSRVTNVGQTLYRTYDFNNVTHAYNGTTRAWSNPSISEQIGQIGGVITSNGTLVIDSGDLSNLDLGRDAPNVVDSAVLANLNTGAARGADASTVLQVGGGTTVTDVAGGPVRNATAAQLADATGAPVQGPAAGTASGPAAIDLSGADATAPQQVTADPAHGPGTVVTLPTHFALPTNSLFQVTPNGGHYLVETDPRFADYRSWLGSDYLLDALGYDPANLHKRLGDGYYEQKLIREQVGQLTGRRFLDGHASDEEQFRALMEAGVRFAQQYGLRPGVALSAAQMAQLTSDIVWLVEQTVTLPDGSTATVLVPQVYLRLRPGDISENGALLAGENVRLNLRGDVVNTGDIAGRQVVSIRANNLDNLAGGAISGRAVGLQAAQDINVIGATVTARDLLSVQAGGDVTVASTTQTLAGGGFHAYEQTSLNRVAGLYVTNPGGLGVLSVSAGGDVTLQAAQLHNAGTNGLTQIAAVGNVNLTTLTTGRSTDTTYDSKNHWRTAQTTHVGTTVQGAGDVVVQAGNDVNLTAAQLSAGNAPAVQAGNDLHSQAVVDSTALDVAQAGRKSSRSVSASDETVRGSTFSAGGDIALQAGNDITLQAATVVSEAGGIALAAGRDVNLTAAQEEHAYQQDTTKKKSGTFSSTKTTTHDQTFDSIGVGATLSGETVQIGAGRDIVTEAAQVAGTGDVLLAAGRHIDIGTAQNTHVEQHEVTQKKSGVFGGGGASGLGGIGFTAGSQKASSRITLEQHTTTGSLIGSVEGNVTMVAGGDITVTGSDLMAGRAADDVEGVGGNIALQGQNIAITSAEQTEHYESHQKSKSSGVTMALTGTPLDTVRNLQQNNQNAPTQTDKTHGTLNEIAAAGLTTPQLAIGYGKSQSQSDTVIDTTTQRGSTVMAAGNLTLKATGNGQTDASGKPLDGDITVIGSSIAVGDTATFDAQRDVNLLASTDTQSQSSSSSSSTTQLTLAAPSWGDLSRHVHGGANSSGVRMSPYNSGRSSSESGQTAIGQTATTVHADRVNIVSRQGDITLQGAQVDGVSGINLLAKEGDIYLLPGQTEQSWEEVNRSKQVGDLGGDGYAGTVGVRKEQHTVDGSQSSQNAIRTSLSSAQGDVNVVAKGDVTGQGVDIVAGRDVLLAGRNVTLDPATDTVQQVETHRVSQYGTTLALSGTAVQAVQAAEAAGRAAEAGDTRLAALYAAQGAYAARDAGMSASSTANNGGGNLIKVTASVGGGSQSSQSGFADTAQQGSTVTGGRNVTVIATGDGTVDADGYATTGDITLRGAQVNAGNNVTLDAARDLNLLSSQDTSEQDSDHRSGSASVGVGFGLGGQQNGFTIELAAAAARGEAEGDGTTHQATRLNAGNTLTLSSGRDTTLHGAQAVGETVIADVGRNLTLSSTQDAQTYDQRDQSASAGVSICVPPLCFGTSSGSVSASQTDIHNNYRSTTQQTGIAAGSGGFDLTVGGHTQLDGAVIASTAAPELNRLSTDSLGVTHLDNVAEYSASSVSVSYSGSGTAGNQSGPGYSGGFSPGLAVPQSESASSLTRSDIAAGTVEVRNGDVSALAGLDRTATELQSEGLENRFDLEEVQGNLEAGQIAGQVGMRAAGDLANRMGWEEGSMEKAILHGAVAAAIAALGGGDAWQGLTGAATSQLATVAMQNYLRENGIDPNSPEGRSLMDLGSLAVGAAVGGGSGAAAALYGEQFNRQLHPDERALIRGELSDKYAKANGLTKEEAIRVLEAQLLRMVDADAASAGGWDAQAFAYLRNYAYAQNSPTIGHDQWGNSVPLFGTSAGYQRQDSTIFSAHPQTTTPPPTLGLGAAGDYASNLLEGVGEVVGGTVDKLLHPIDTAGAIWDGITGFFNDPVGTGQSMQEGARPMADAGEQGNLGPAGEFMGQQAGGTLLGLGAGLTGQWIAGKWVPGNSIVDAGVNWGKGIQGQGLPWENYLAAQLPAGSRLPPNFKTFDFFDPTSNTAISAKTLDTMTPAKLANPSQVYSSLKGNIDSAANFSEARLGTTRLRSSDIASRELRVAVPAGTTPAQWQQIQRAIEYGRQRGVTVRITPVKGGGG